MKRAKKWFLLSVMVLIVVSAIELSAEQAKEEPKFTVRKLPPQTVFYTIYRGSYEKMGEAIGNLYALAGQKGIFPRGLLSCLYLNNPQHVSCEHLLTEIRIPVGADAIRLAGTLGEMTDVKTVPAIDVAVTMKPKGVADPAPIYKSLGLWIFKEGYMAIEGPIEVYHLTGKPEGSYAQMESEIMIPVQKMSQSED